MNDLLRSHLNWLIGQGRGRGQLKTPGILNLSGLSDDEKLARITSICLILIGVVLIVSMAADRYLIGVLMLAVPGMFFLLVGSPVRVLMMAFALQIVLSISQLNILLTVISVLVILVVFTISALGILSASNIARRTGTESGSYLTDISTLSRLIA